MKLFDSIGFGRAVMCVYSFYLLSQTCTHTHRLSYACSLGRILSTTFFSGESQCNAPLYYTFLHETNMSKPMFTQFCTLIPKPNDVSTTSSHHSWCHWDDRDCDTMRCCARGDTEIPNALRMENYQRHHRITHTHSPLTTYAFEWTKAPSMRCPHTKEWEIMTMM